MARWWLGILLGVCIVLAVRLWPDPEPEVCAPDSPHVVLYLIDTLRADRLSAYGYPRPTTPHIDAVAADGVVFERAYAPASWTRPSTASLLTGLLPGRHGAERFEHRLGDEFETLTEHLRAAGYRTAGFVTNPNLLSPFGFDQGFDTYVDVESAAGTGDAGKLTAAIFRYLDAWAAGGGSCAPGAQPLFLYVHSRDPHDPYEPPPEFAERFVDPDVSSPLERSSQLYDAEIAFNDSKVGELVGRLRGLGIWDDAVFVLVSDHGEEFAEHGGRHHGITLFEEQLHVPFVLRLPEGRFAGRRVGPPVRLTDVTPTLLDWLGLPVPEDLDGASLRPLLAGDPPPGSEAEPLFLSELDLFGQNVQALRKGDLKLIVRHAPANLARTRLYDLAADPGEQEDLVDERPEQAAALAAELERLAAGPRAGTRLLLANDIALEARHRVGGVVRALDGRIVEVDPLSIDRAAARIVDAGAAVEIDLELANSESPVDETAQVLVRLARLRLRTDPPDARLRLELTLDGEPLESSQILLGPEGRPLAAGAPLEFDPADPSVQLGREPWVEKRLRHHGVYVQLVHVPPPPDASVEIDAELEERLRALGYSDGGAE